MLHAIGAWLAARLAETTSHASVAGAILIGAAVLDHSVPDWHAAVKPLALCLIAFLYPEIKAPVPVISTEIK
jgi:pimeloyl-ACP methyl ester carboxylesterase